MRGQEQVGVRDGLPHRDAEIDEVAIGVKADGEVLASGEVINDALGNLAEQVAQRPGVAHSVDFAGVVLGQARVVGRVGRGLFLRRPGLYLLGDRVGVGQRHAGDPQLDEGGFAFVEGVGGCRGLGRVDRPIGRVHGNRARRRGRVR